MTAFEPDTVPSPRRGTASFRQTVGQVMTTKVVSLAPGDTVAAAIDLFVKWSFRHMLVADGGRLVGVLSDRDALRHMARGNDPFRSKVRDVMKAQPIVVTPETPLTKAIELLRANRINCLPVVSVGDAMVGILTTTDLLGTLLAILAGDPPA
jgi:CBS domain-containing protein